MSLVRHFREVGKDVVTYGFFSALAQLSGLVLLPVLTRVLSVEEYGAVDIFATFVALMSAICRFALPSAVNRFYYELEDTESRKALFTTLLAFAAVLGAFITTFASIVLAPVAERFIDVANSSTFVFFGCLVATLNALVALPQAVLRLQRRIAYYNLIAIVNTSLYMVLAIVFVAGFEYGVEGVFVAHAAATSVAFVLSLVFTRQALGFRFSSGILRRSLAFSLPLVPSVLVAWANEQTDRVILLSLSGLGAVAVFGAAAKIAAIYHFVVITFRQAWQPYSMALIKAPDRDEVYRTVLDCYVAGAVVIAVAFTAISTDICNWVLPVEYQISSLLVPWMLGTALLHHSLTITNLGIMVSERTTRLMTASMVAVVVNIGLSVPLIMTLGVIGAALGAFTAEFCLSVLLLIHSNRLSTVGFRLKPMLLCMLFFVVGTQAMLTCGEAGTLWISIGLRILVLFGVTAVIYYVALDENTRRIIRGSVGGRSPEPP
jgi:O-antigen/teichoic acid export membrane protein